MKTLLQSVFAIVLFAAPFTLSAQFVSIKYPGDNHVFNGGYAVSYGNPTDSYLEQRFWVYNETNQEISVSLERVELDVAAGTQNATCWSICPAPVNQGAFTTLESDSIQDIAVGGVDKTFSIYLYPQGVSGCSHFRIYYYIDGMPSMRDSVDVYFDHGASCQAVAGMEENTIQDLNPTMKVYPNPSNGEVNLDMELPQGIDYSMKVVNVVGQNVIDQTTVTSGVQTMDWTSLNPGMYFVILSDGEKAVMTKKIQITR